MTYTPRRTEQSSNVGSRDVAMVMVTVPCPNFLFIPKITTIALQSRPT